jgi:hypothetical protein
MTVRLSTLALVTALIAPHAVAEPVAYPWPARDRAADTLARRFVPPAGFVRSPAPADSFRAWLRVLPLRAADAPVRLHTGALKGRQDVHAGVIDIDVGQRDLQQCADAVMRLRAEWQFATGQTTRIAFNETGGGNPMPFTRWANGERPRPAGNTLTWHQTARADASYTSFRRYMDTVFVWAGTHSLEKELRPLARGAPLAIGDVIIKGGFPGHAVLVADLIENPTTKEQRILLVQSYMPAQDIHVLVDPASPDRSPWYGVPTPDAPFVTPEWTFPPGSVRRFAN